jgi:hypothetical protein
MAANGMFIVNLSPPAAAAPGEPAYLSPGHMDEVKFVVAEAAKRSMRLWIQDESPTIPSGFAGGYISPSAIPQLTMQVMAADLSPPRAVTGETLLDGPSAHRTTLADLGHRPETTPARPSQSIQIPLPADGQLKWQRRFGRLHAQRTPPQLAGLHAPPHLPQLADPRRRPRRWHGRAKDATLLA